LDADKKSCCAPLSVTFTDKSSAGDNPIVKWEWDLDGDGTYETSGKGPHDKTYTAPGTYTVSLKVTDSHGCTDTETKKEYIKSNEGPTAQIDADPLEGCEPLKVEFTDKSYAGDNPIVKWEWDLDGNGSYETSGKGPHTKTYSAGSYTVKLKVTDKHGCEDSTTEDITVDPKPKVSVNDDEVCAGDTGTLTATADPATGVSYLWNTGAKTKSINVTAAGTYTCTVTIDATGCQASDSGTLTVYLGPTAEFSSNSPVYLGQPVKFTDLSTKGFWPIVKWEWDFGDGKGTSSQQHPQYTYDATGTYTVTLKVTDQLGCEDTVKHPVTVLDSPTRYICGYVYYEGTTDGLANAVVRLQVYYQGVWKTAGSYTTGPSGFFEFRYKGMIDKFRLWETNPPGYESTGATPILWGTVINWDVMELANPPYTPPGLCHFIFYDKLPPGPGPSCIGDYVWHDKNWDGIQDPGEKPLPKITVFLKDANGNLITSMETNVNGNYLFDGLTAGTYWVEVDVDDPDLPFGFMPTTSTIVIYDLGIDECYRGADFGFAAECPGCPDWITFHTDRDDNWEIYRLGPDLLNLSNNPATDMAPTRSPDATTVAYQSDRHGNWDIFLVRGDGSNTMQLTFDPAHDIDPNWSGECGMQRIAFQSDRDGQWEIYTVNADGSGLQRVTFNGAADTDPFWSPDCVAGMIAFQSDRNGNWDIYVVDVVTLEEQLLAGSPASDVDPVWSPCGERIAFISDRDGQSEVYVVEVATGQETRITFSEGDEKNIAWSPDSVWLAYQSDRDGQWELYVARSNGQLEMRVTDAAADDEAPSWDCGSEWLVFHSDRDDNPEIYGINAMTGQGLTRKTDNPANDLCPMWMPSEEDGSLFDVIPPRGLSRSKGW
jgi:PKD repeat protein